MKQYNKTIEVLRAFLIFSVVCAHTAVAGDTSPTSSLLAVRIMSCLALVGVPGFLVLAGFFLSKTKDNLGAFTKKKLFTIVVPWIFCFTVLWLYVVLRKGGMELRSWLEFIIGKGSAAYFVVVLLFLYVISFPFRKNKIFTTVGVVISAFWFFTKGFMPVDSITKAFISEYHVTFYWLGYFCLGMMVALNGWWDGIQRFSLKYLWVFATLSVTIVVVLCYKQIPISYFDYYTFPITLVWLLTLIGLSSLEIFGNASLPEKVGNDSFTIYLTHQLFSGLIIHLTSKVDCFITVFIRPFLNIAIVVVLVWLYRVINNVLGGKLTFVSCLVGIKQKKEV